MRRRADVKMPSKGQAIGFPNEALGTSFDAVRAPESEAVLQLRRLAVFQRDLNAALDLLNFAGDTPAPSENQTGMSRTIQEGLYDAALVLLVRCFEPTSGLRTQPLSIKKVFSPPERVKFKKLLTIRNKIVAHDEQLFGSVNVLIARQIDMSLQAIATMITGVTFFAMKERRDIKPLVKSAIVWTENATSPLRAKISREYDALPFGDRMALQPFAEHYKEVVFTQS